MSRRQFMMILGAAVACPLAANAQQAGAAHRIGVLETTGVALNAVNLTAFRQGLKQRGYIEGQNIVIEYRSADGRDDRFPDLAAELVALPVDVIVTRGTPAALAARSAAGMIPIVMAASGDPLGTGLVASLARPGGNITGLSAFVRELMAKRLELLKESMAGVARVAALLNMDNPAAVLEWDEIAASARLLGIESRLLDVRRPEGIAPAFDSASSQKFNALIVGLDSLTQTNRNFIIELAAMHRLPAFYPSREFVDAGGLIAYGVSYPDLYRRAATYVDKILKGAKPADLPIQQPTKFELVINLKTAKALGVTIPEVFLLRADEVIE
jgi:putative ABC transport system substrate-binding protein